MKLALMRDSGGVVSSWDSHDEDCQEFWTSFLLHCTDWLEPEDAVDIRYDLNEQVDAQDRLTRHQRDRDAEATAADEARDRAKDERP